MAQLTGKCLCGAVSFSFSGEPVATRICWCRDCQHVSANGTVNLLVHSDGLTHSGALAEYTKTADSGNELTREFCPKCGTHLFGKTSARPQFRVVRVGNLDNPSAVRPTSNIWTSSAPEWACMDDSLEQVEKQPGPPNQSPT